MRKMTDPRKIRQTAIANQLPYKGARKKIEAWFNIRKIPIDTEIWVYNNYPYGYEAVVGAWERVWIFKYFCTNINGGYLSIKDIQPVQGFLPNGALIVSEIPYSN